ncbi:MAG: YidC/Oxa1 family insertase periplasmic-domain containing protein [Phycisphaerales bacterium]|nr:YidC/Oxa1 family insertase periplasmic-domain containing protein [Phycisphaerales bacterium]
MPKQENKYLRPLAVVAAILVIVGGGFAFLLSSQQTQKQAEAQKLADSQKQAGAPKQAPAPAQPVAGVTPAAAAPAGESVAASPNPSNAAPAIPVVATGGATSTIDTSGWNAKVWPSDAASGAGTLSDTHLLASFSSVGAGLSELSIADRFETIQRTTPVVVQREHQTPQYGPDGRSLKTADGRDLVAVVAPLAAIGVEVNGKFINLSVDAAGSLWKRTGPFTFLAEIGDASGATALRITREYSIAKGTRQLSLTQKIENVGGQGVNIRWYQMGPVDLPKDAATYIGEKRRLRFGYLLAPAYDTTQSFVQSHDFVIDHAHALGTFGPKGYDAELTHWPNPTSQERAYSLSWIGLTNRYFGVALHGPHADTSIAGRKFSSIENVDRLVLLRPTLANGQRDDVMALRTTSPTYAVAPGTALDLSMDLYAGALIRTEMRADASGKALSLDGLVVYTMGGPCAFCTFDFLTSGLLWLLVTLHNSITYDWALAIVLLVVIVRTCLHPITKWSQVRMQRFGKQMQGMAPKQAKLKEKYGHDPKLLQQETAKLWREEGINPLGMLGCIPMFLQMPIWIALYATLFFAAELRHQAGFYGLFQWLGHPTFLADLSVPDTLYQLTTKPEGIHIPLLSSLLGPIHGINILPLIFAGVLHVHQTYLTPQTTTMTPEQESQQKMIKWMSVIMVPLFMYNAPAGLTIYFLANSTLGILEHKRIRKHIDKHDLLNLDKIKAAKGKSGPGFLGRMQELAEAQRKAAEAKARKGR